ncbi:MliC family protein [Methylotuvimicrobium buryatense]|uniref:C-type lysozyme inhibitor domain-containing protein n=1 Tax=Methylotuvimicrobium buryatense TaxID=95641 RepID=A0A4P9ULK2_METBY|nr:MliC family protein [Methylotuvimicrobium buryatense]QCW82078.1 hypothetical protein EQU24_07330 [Methylotuvimicrobium buryatense]
MSKFLFIINLTILVTACAQQVKHDSLNPFHFDGTPVTSGIIEGSGWRSKIVVYHCHPDTELQVAYLNLQSGESFAALYYQGLLSLMQIRKAASGALYIALDEQKSLRWHTKGDSGILKFLAADDTATEQILLSDCKAI